MATKETGTNAAKPKGKPRGKGKPFVTGDERRNQNGQRSAAAVRTAAEMRDLYVAVLHEKNADLKPDPNATNMETVVRRHVLAACNGDAGQREQLIDRIWGRATQPVKHEFDDLPDGELIQRAAQLTAGIAAILAVVASGDK